MKRRITALFLALALLCAILPTALFSASAAGTSGTCGDNLTWTLNTDTGELVISGTGPMTDFEWQRSPWVWNNSIRSVYFSEGVTSIGNHAFEYCNNLTSITIPDSVTSIGDSAFEDCNLTTITIPDSVMSIGKSAFADCYRLTGFTVDEKSTAFSTDASGNLFNKDQTELICCLGGYSGAYTIPDSVISIGDYAFYDCYKLTNIKIPDSVTSIGDLAFYGCSSLTSITIPDSVTSIGNAAFQHCKFTIVTIPDSVTSIGGLAFYDCSSLTSITIGNGVTSIGDLAFYGCSSLTSITIPGSVMSIGDDAFYECNSLTSVSIDGSRSGVTGIGNRAFMYCDSLTNVTLGNGTTSIGDRVFCGCESLTSITILGSVTSIGESAFENCDGLTSITIPDSVTSIGMGAFCSCKNLTSVSVGGGITEIRNSTFAACKSLTSMTIPDTVTKIGAFAFDGCCNLTSIMIPASVTYIDMDAFNNCSGLTSITIPASVKTVDWAAFSGCTLLSTVFYGGTKDKWDSIVMPANEELKNAFIHYEVTDPATHGSILSTTEPTCTEKGFSIYLCACGSSYKETYTDALGHNWNEGIITIQPTETDEGVRTYTCSRCAATKTESVQKVSHMHSYEEVVTEPTCTEKGYTTHTCSCSDSYIDSYTDALGHNYKEGICSRCGEKDPDYKPPVKPTFTDVNPTAWYNDAVNFAVSNKLFNGVGDNRFAPNTAMNRAMLVTVLWRYAGSPEEGINTFSDVKDGQWYTDAIAWASSNGIVGGVGNGKFNPNGNVTREQMAAILYRYCKDEGISTGKSDNLSAFPDKAKVSSWATDACKWAVGEGLINGNGGKLDPQGKATRAQVATILMRFIQNVVEK